MTGLIRNIPLFQKLDDREFKELERLIEVVGVLTGTTLFKKGEASDAFYVVARGKVEIVLDPEGAGTNRIPLNQGDFFGEMGVLNSAPRTANAVAAEDSVLLKVGKTAFDGFLTMHESIAAKVMAVCLDRGKGHQLPDEAEGGEVVVVWSPRGGAGTTTVAVNFAARVVDFGGTKVALVDGDLQFGSAHLFLGAQGRSDWAALVAGSDRPLAMDEVEKLVVATPRGVQLVRTPSKPEEADLVHPTHLASVVSCLRKRYGTVVVDLPSSLSEKALAVLELSTQVYLVIEPEIVSLHRAVDALRIFELAGFPDDRFRIIVNKQGKGGIPRAEIEKTLRREIYATIARDADAVGQSIHDGKLLVDLRRGSPPAIDLGNLARRFVNPLGGVVEEAPGPLDQPQGRVSFWKLFLGGGGGAGPRPRG